MTPLKFAKENNFAEIAEMRDKILRKMILDFAKEYHESENQRKAHTMKGSTLEQTKLLKKSVGSIN